MPKVTIPYGIYLKFKATEVNKLEWNYFVRKSWNYVRIIDYCMCVKSNIKIKNNWNFF